MAQDIVTTIAREYRDLDLNFIIHPGKKDINVHVAERAIINSLKNLLLTSFYEKPFLPEFGSNLRSLLFEPVNSITANHIKREIEEVIATFEKRVSVTKVDVVPDYDNHIFRVTIEFIILNASLPVTIQLLLERRR